MFVSLLCDLVTILSEAFCSLPLCPVTLKTLGELCYANVTGNASIPYIHALVVVGKDSMFIIYNDKISNNNYYDGSIALLFLVF